MEKFGYNISVKGMSGERKRELFDFIFEEVRAGNVQFKRDQHMIQGAMMRTKGWMTAPPLIYILAETVWQAFKERGNKTFYVTDCKSNAVLGLVTPLTKEEVLKNKEKSNGPDRRE